MPGPHLPELWRRVVFALCGPACPVALSAAFPVSGTTHSICLFPSFPCNPPLLCPLEPLLWPLPPLDLYPWTSPSSSPSRSKGAMASGSVPEELLVPVLLWRMAPGLALAVCPAKPTSKRYFHCGHKVYL